MIRFDEAKAWQLRAFLKQEHGIEKHKTASRASLLKVIRDLGTEGDAFELSEDIAAAAEAEGDAEPTFKPPTDTVNQKALIQALVDQGMDEATARQTAADTAQAKLGREMSARGEKQYGPGKEDLYVTVRIGKKAGKFGDEPVPLGVNGNVTWVPRGIDWPIRTVHLESLMHAEQTEYEEIMIAPDQPRIHKPRVSLTENVQYISPVPYDRAEAERVAARAKAELKAQGDPRAFGQGPGLPELAAA